MKHKRTSRSFGLPKLKRPAVAGKVAALPRAVKKRLSRRRGDNPLEVLGDLPRITNETVAEHREEILRGARKYIYPLQHSRSRIIKVSASLFIAAVVAFFAYCGLALYKFQSTSGFVYEVTRVIPFPIARAGSHFVSYESYLFELRHLTHYYETQQKENFATDNGKLHMAQLKKDSLQKVIDDAFVKQLADDNKITITNRDVNDQIALVKSQNRLGSSDQMLEDVLNQFWGWDLDDFKRELKSQLLSQKVASELDTAAHARAANALAELRSGADFAATAAKYSDDAASKDKGGAYPAAISRTTREVQPQVVAALFSLQPGQVSPVVETSYSLEIVRNNNLEGEKILGSHIQFNLQPIGTYLKPLQDKEKTYRLITVADPK